MRRLYCQGKNGFQRFCERLFCVCKIDSQNLRKHGEELFVLLPSPHHRTRARGCVLLFPAQTVRCPIGFLNDPETFAVEVAVQNRCRGPFEKLLTSHFLRAINSGLVMKCLHLQGGR